MKTRAIERGFVLKLERGEELVETVCQWAAALGIAAGEVRGIGTLADIELGYFDLETREYQRTVLPAAMELLVLQGNLAQADGAPMLHAHVVLAGPDLVARGGHLFRAAVAATVELFFAPTATPLVRELDEDVNLKLLAF